MRQTTSGEERAQFLEFLLGTKIKIFINKEEVLAYYMDDVNVLRQAYCAFRNLVLKLVKMDPFRQVITIPSICNKVFRTMFPKTDTLVIIPRGGYRMGEGQSVEALQWLSSIFRKRNNVTHAGNGREVHLGRVPNVKVEGHCSETNDVF
jgi:hypothetical protein